jgi:hypothetical protein
MPPSPSFQNLVVSEVRPAKESMSVGCQRSRFRRNVCFVLLEIEPPPFPAFVRLAFFSINRSPPLDAPSETSRPY